METKALFVEDEERGVFPYFSELKIAGFECVLAKDGDEAIEKLQNQKFDLISIDIMFPPGEALGENIDPVKAGLRLLEKIRTGQIENCDPETKVLVLTAVSDQVIEKHIRELGVSAYLKKPMDYYEVINVFSELKKKILEGN